MPFNDDQLLSALKAAADPTRLKILRLLKQKGSPSIGKHTAMCASDIQEKFSLTQPTISHHMSVLSRAGLVTAQKHGLWMWYRRNEKSLKQVARALGGNGAR